jgi:predicted O-linked N-acetylglucosamine transferase (SPINDLY family)
MTRPAGEPSVAQAFSRHMAGDSAGAERACLAVLAREPDDADALQLLGSLVLRRGDAAAALAWFDASLAAAAPSAPNAFVWANRGAALRDLGRPSHAIASCERALALDPRCRDAWLNAGAAWLDLRRLEAASGCFDRAIALDPADARAHAGRGLAMAELRRLDEAVASYGLALQRDPRQAGTWRNRGNARVEQGDTGAAIADYREAMSLDPTMAFLPGDLLHACMSACDWAPLADGFARLRANLADGRAVVTPFVARGIPLSAREQRQCADVFATRVFAAVDAEKEAGESDSPPAEQASPSNRRIRLGYFSADFRQHVMSQLVCGLLERHDRGRFEVVAFSFGGPSDDAMRERIRLGVDQFVDVDGLTDQAVAALSRRMGIDIAVDLTGCTRRARPGVFAWRAAPVQIGFLGDPGTSGSRWAERVDAAGCGVRPDAVEAADTADPGARAVPLLDYLVADHTLVPAHRVADHAECIVFMPHTYQANSHALLWPVREVGRLARRDVGLPEAGFVFCAFHQPYKITPEAFDAWMRLLREVQGSVLWLLADNPLATCNLKREATARGVDPDRLVFAPRTSAQQHQDRFALADLFLDSFDYNAHATASDALWAGLPLVTRIGETFASRVAASLLRAVGMSEWITRSTAEYVELALALARDPQALAAGRRRLETHRDTQPLFDTARFTRHWEAGLDAIHQRAVRHLAPAQIDIRTKP